MNDTKIKAFAMTARIILEELEEMMRPCGGAMCEDCPMEIEHDSRRPDCLFDVILPRLREIEEGEKKGSEK